MEEKVLLGRGRQIIEIPAGRWKKHLEKAPEHDQERHGLMTEAHQLVRYFAVSELARMEKPLPPEHISEKLKMPLEQVRPILDELERKLFFLVRDAQGAVAWAYPVTVEPTPHRLNFSTGERLYGA